MREIEEIIKNYIIKLNRLPNTLNYKLNDKSEVYSPRLVINKDWTTIENTPRIIICGDNPGIKEEKENKFFIAKAGNILKEFIDVIKYQNEIEDSEILFFNKTPYHSSKSSSLNNELNDEKENVKKSIELTINTLFDIWVLDNSIKFYFFGVDKSTFINECFFEIIEKNEFNDFYEQLYFLNHPSYHSLNKSIGAFLMKKFNKLKDFQLNLDDFIKDLSDCNKERIKPTK